MALLYGRGGRLIAQNGGLRPGQMFDWVHNGEGLTTFNLHGLTSPGR